MTVAGVIDYTTNPNQGLYAVPLVLTPANSSIFGAQAEKLSFQYYKILEMDIRVTAVDPSQPGVSGVSISP